MKGMNKLHNFNKQYINPHNINMPMCSSEYFYNIYKMYPYPLGVNVSMYGSDFYNQSVIFEDYGPQPFVVNIEEATKQNNAFRRALWTGDNLQVTLMSIGVGEDIGLEVHPELDQFIRIEEGTGITKMGDNKNKLDFQKDVYDDFAFIVPAGKWHNLINTGDKPLKLYSIYAPPQHPKGTIHETKEDAEASEDN